MDSVNKKKRLIKRQVTIRKFFGLCFMFFLGILYSYIVTATNQNSNNSFMAIGAALGICFWILLLTLLFMIVTYYQIGKREKSKSNSSLERIEKLGDLKLKGLISEQEFETEKRKIWEEEL